MSWRGVLKKYHTEAKRFTIDRGDHQLYCRSWGTGEPVYLLNGFGGTSELFALLAAVLSQDFRCVLFDEYSPEQPGKISFRQQTPAEWVDDLFAIADHCHDDVISLYGASLGGALALTAMQARPERVQRAVLQGAFAHRKLTSVERLLTAACRLLPGQVRRLPLRTTVQQQNHRLWFPPFDGSRWKFLLDNTGDVPLKILAQRASLAGRIDLRERLSEIPQPVLILQTEGEGRITAACQEELKAGLPQVEDTWIDNTGQLPFLTHPHRLAKLLRPFFHGEPLPSSLIKAPGELNSTDTPSSSITENHVD